MRRVNPKVFVVAETKLDDDGMSDYLAHVGASEWRTDAPSPGEALAEFMGRLCYRSWKPLMNANVTKVREGNDVYLANIMKSRHGSVIEHGSVSFVFADVSRVLCYAPGTEAFTSSGWMRIEDLTTNDELLTMNPETKCAEWSKPESVHSFDYVGSLMSWESSQMGAPRMTPDHLLWAAFSDKRRARGLTNEENVAQHAFKVPFSAAFGKRFAIDHGVRFAKPLDPAVFEIGGHSYDAYDFMCWLGWMATDGGFSIERPNQCTIVQSKCENLSVIETLMESLFPGRWRKHGPYGDAELVQFTINDADLAERARETIGPNKSERRLAPWIFGLHPRLLRGFYESAVAGDGSIHKENGHEVLYCPNETMSGQFQVLAACIGMTANVRPDDRTGTEREWNGSTIRHTKPTYIVSMSRKSASMVKIEMQRAEEFSGKVYCPKTKNGLIYVRGTGLPFWAGNTHELVRHRVGVGISQESLRYVRLTDLGLWLPPEIEADPEDAALFEKCFEDLEALQLHLAKKHGLDDEASFDAKKKLTSAFRRIAPEGLATTIGWTTNHRNLRHVLRERSARHAEAEIRVVFAEVGRIAKARWPNIYSDFVGAEVDGVTEWTTNNVKV